MPKSRDPDSTPTSRRSLLYAAPAVMVLAGAGIGGAVQAAPPCADAELIAHCAMLDALERTYLETDFEDDAADPKREAIAQAQHPIVDAICAQPPQTLPGFLALARSLALWDREAINDPGPGGCTNERLLAALLQGAADTTPAPVAAPHPDAALLALCAAFHRQYAEAHDEANPAWEAANGASFDIFKELDDLTPATEAGHRAKARVAVVMLAMFNEGDGYSGGDPQAMFALNLLRDWLGEA